jgi:hypothetical protein
MLLGTVHFRERIDYLRCSLLPILALNYHFLRVILMVFGLAHLEDGVEEDTPVALSPPFTAELSPAVH